MIERGTRLMKTPISRTNHQNKTKNGGEGGNEGGRDDDRLEEVETEKERARAKESGENMRQNRSGKKEELITRKSTQ
ncbi:hypothetical protein BO86DRAFT_185745 [Aspergillus japonicus CBS 114.51]|uniref:Uncharacterized protein n=2 Tax=Aspergillus TaxID=5052 RepID=A0A2V5IC99_ASPV1|nr:hypothetical protein BO86DRAFT_185745 [Aspergillus japonicus CBS 114.51]PYI17256.1 hypothetical protein BO99DRAFT_195812 [Aspergillus violaceofuscus CBS 115571]RAH85225.1 hypothetical protein BO86DRAFT_185745 [Aspergillus japonicus CBS 114.51]